MFAFYATLSTKILLLNIYRCHLSCQVFSFNGYS